MHFQPFFRSALLASFAVVFAACGKKTDTGAAAATGQAPKSTTTVAVVEENRRSKNFEAVNRQLDLGGSLYGYVDVDGDVLKLTGMAKEWLQQASATQPQLAMAAHQDLDGIAQMLGLTDIKAVGISSVADGTGFFRNRMFFYTGGERHGLMAGLGGKPGPLKHVNLAPADAAFYGEAEIDMAIVYKTIKEVVAKVAGEPVGNMLEQSLQQAGQAAALSILDLIYGLKGRSALVMRVDPEKTMLLPGKQPLIVPAFSLVLCVDGVGQVLEPALTKSPMLRRSQRGTTALYELPQALPIEGLRPAIVIDGGTLFFTTSLPFLDECRARTNGLAQTSQFQQALQEVGAESNGISYLSPKLFEQIRRIPALNEAMPEETRQMFALVMRSYPEGDRPIVASRVNLDDGILVRAHMNRSFKQEIVTAAVYPAGLMAAMAIPAFQKVRTSSQEKAILNNLRQLAAAADQYYLEHGKTTVTYDQLVGPTDKHYIKNLQSVAGEDYSEIEFKSGEPLRVMLPDGRVIESEN